MLPIDAASLPGDVRARFVDGVTGLRMHLLEAGHEGGRRPLALLLHGFPELAYSWRNIIGPLAAAGFHVVAPDLRGYGRTTGWSADYDQDLAPFSMLGMVADVAALIEALGYSRIDLLVGHDFGSPVAAWCALARPELVRSLVMMSAPFAGAPAQGSNEREGIDGALAALARPRKHYHWYYATRPANADMVHAGQGLSAFLRAYFHHKSADWAGNAPFKLRDWSADELAKMPTYYIMDRAATMAETVAPFMPNAEEVARCRWLTEAELAIYAGEYARTGFQGGLNMYRTRFDPQLIAAHAAYAGRTIDVPSLFLSGAKDWGTYQAPGALERMRDVICTEMVGVHLIEGAGHWVMQEQPEAVLGHLVRFALLRAGGRE